MSLFGNYTLHLEFRRNFGNRRPTTPHGELTAIRNLVADYGPEVQIGAPAFILASQFDLRLQMMPFPFGGTQLAVYVETLHKLARDKPIDFIVLGSASEKLEAPRERLKEADTPPWLRVYDHDDDTLVLDGFRSTPKPKRHRRRSGNLKKFLVRPRFHSKLRRSGCRSKRPHCTWGGFCYQNGPSDED